MVKRVSNEAELANSVHWYRFWPPS